MKTFEIIAVVIGVITILVLVRMEIADRRWHREHDED